MPTLVNIIGERYGRLVVLKRAANNKYGLPAWDCICDCGTICTVSGKSMKAGHTTSCGCAYMETRKGAKTHGMYGTPEYNVWAGIIRRCTDKNQPHYNRYGGRGICVCRSWRNSFASFYKDMGDRPSVNHSLDRINNDGNYTKNNCRWATRAEQLRNTSRNVNISLYGETKCMADWCREHGVTNATILYHKGNGKSWEDIFSKYKRIFK